MNTTNNDINSIIDIDKTSDGKLTVSTTAVQKLIYGLLISEHYKVNLNGITIINQRENTNLEARIQLLVEKDTNLITLKQKVIKLVLNRISSILNINFININLIFNAVN